MPANESNHPSGKQKLMTAAMELAATTRSLANLGIRELSRHAGLNPNTFYRHFESFDELGLTMFDELGKELRDGLREQRMQPTQGNQLDPDNPAATLEHAQSVACESVKLVLEFVSEHRNAYIVGTRELFGTSAALRNAMNKLLDAIAHDITEDIFAVLPFPEMPKQELDEVAQIIVRQMVFFSMDTIEQPERREEIHRKAEKFILLIFWGGLSAWMPDQIEKTGLSFPAI